MSHNSMFEMMFHACIAAFCIVIGALIFANYCVQLVDPVIRASMVARDIAAIMLICIMLLTICAYNVFKSVHWFLKWHDSMKRLG